MAVDQNLVESVAGGKSVLITGAGGSIGSGLARRVLEGKPRILVLLDSSEGALYECYRRLLPLLPKGTTLVPSVGSIVDQHLTTHLLQQYSPALVLHAAAYKHVPLMEQNPFSAIANNSVGTYRLVLAALKMGVSQLVMLSTDKAVNPQSIMGASKRIAEQIVLAYATEGVRMNAVRLGNVLGSAGSVVPIFLEQLAGGLPLTITHPEAQRYFLTPEEAEAAVLRTAARMAPGKILVADCGEALKIVELAKFVARKRAARCSKMPKIIFIGHRAGDKLSERLVSEWEQIDPERVDGMRVVTTPYPPASKIADVMERLLTAIEKFDSAAAMAAVGELVPDYGPAHHTGFHAPGLAEVR